MAKINLVLSLYCCDPDFQNSNENRYRAFSVQSNVVCACALFFLLLFYLRIFFQSHTGLRCLKAFKSSLNTILFSIREIQLNVLRKQLHQPIKSRDITISQLELYVNTSDQQRGWETDAWEPVSGSCCGGSCREILCFSNNQVLLQSWINIIDESF